MLLLWCRPGHQSLQYATTVIAVCNNSSITLDPNDSNRLHALPPLPTTPCKLQHYWIWPSSCCSRGSTSNGSHTNTCPGQAG